MDLHGHPGPRSDASVPQLLDAVEKRLDSLAETLSQNDVTLLNQIDDTILKISTILRKAKSIKNCLAPIDQIPPETLALIATFFPTERDLVNATVVCQHWRTTLLSFPRLWRNAGGSSSEELEAYFERSKSVPIEVSLSYPHLAVSILPHTSRLTALTVCVDYPSGLEEIAGHLCDPIPTLLSLEIRTTNHQLHTLELPPGLREGLFSNLRKLSLNGISSFHGPQTFPHITELLLHTSPSPHRSSIALLETLGQLPGLVKVSVVFRDNWYTEIHSPDIVTLPCVQEMCLSASTANMFFGLAFIPPILQFLKLPKATSITLESSFPWKPDLPVLPVRTFGDQLPNYVELPELRIDMATPSTSVIFRSPSQAVFTYHCVSLWNYERERQLWGDLPLSSVRRVTADVVSSGFGRGDTNTWLVDILKELDFLELLELRGDCGMVLRRLRRRLVRGDMRINIKTLIVRGGEYAKSQALKFESAKDDLGLQNMTVTHIPDPEARESVQDPDIESTDDEDRDGGFVFGFGSVPPGSLFGR